LGLPARGRCSFPAGSAGALLVTGLPCRSPMIMSNHTLLTCGVRAGEQRDLAGVPDDHEQSGTVVMGAGAGDPG
jgi:hypothetical protein